MKKAETVSGDFRQRGQPCATFVEFKWLLLVLVLVVMRVSFDRGVSSPYESQYLVMGSR